MSDELDYKVNKEVTLTEDNIKAAIEYFMFHKHQEYVNVDNIKFDVTNISHMDENFQNEIGFSHRVAAKIKC